ncbi:hypothetical protein [Neopusillimonas maritima]|uniref:Cell envelope biogenesis protein TolA n=1 Tax=Neopusillimonas maritima TaxID=2026239 RepID=A0A3A1YWQ8_9BURK|nr:hypothetical protein [Neopusillimonas maritima]RIY41986.1 hypothetical protein CJP73_00630 [Neopusillimonas maritima]
MSEVLEKQSTELVELPPAETALQVYQKPNGLDPWLQRIRDQVTGVAPDLTTKKGRDEIASRAFKVRKSKTALDNLGKKLVDDLKEIPKKIDAERKRVRETLDALADEVRKPLTEWEAAEEARQAKHNSNVSRLHQFGTNASQNLESEVLRDMIAEVDSILVDESWEEFEAEAHRAKAKAMEALSTALAVREKYEAEQAELARLRAEAEARTRKDEEERIAREAAERAQREAEAKAQAEREAAAKREAEAKVAAERRELELTLQAEKAERERLEAIERAEQEKRDAEERHRQALEAERKRQADEAARVEAEAKAREADRAHKSKIMRSAKEAVMNAGITEDQARDVIKLIAAGHVPNVRIHY